MTQVYINKLAKFLPNKAIDNSELEEYLGYVNNKPSRSKNIVLRSNGILNRYYALDKSGNATHTNAELASLAIKKLFDTDPDQLKDIDLLACGTSSPDQVMPSHAVMVHGELPETKNIEVVSPSGNCCSGMHALKYAFLSIKSGQKENAVIAASERLTRQLMSEQFEEEVSKLESLEKNPTIAFEKEFLRWMLSDGAAAAQLTNKPNPEGLSLKMDWIEGFSFANEVETCMYMAADKLADGSLKSFKDFEPNELMGKSIFSMKQDVKLLSANIVNLGLVKLKEIYEKRGEDIKSVDLFLPHLSSFFFKDKIAAGLEELEISIPADRWFTNLATKGNVGAASIFLMLEELLNEHKLEKGQKLLLAVPESARFSYVFCGITVC